MGSRGWERHGRSGARALGLAAGARLAAGRGRSGVVLSLPRGHRRDGSGARVRGGRQVVGAPPGVGDADRHAEHRRSNFRTVPRCRVSRRSLRGRRGRPISIRGAHRRRPVLCARVQGAPRKRHGRNQRWLRSLDRGSRARRRGDSGPQLSKPWGGIVGLRRCASQVVEA
jgi:hypothetical protein